MFEKYPSAIQTLGSNVLDFLTEKTGLAVGLGCAVAFTVYLVKRHGTRLAAMICERVSEHFCAQVDELRAGEPHEGFSNPSTDGSSQKFAETASVETVELIDVEMAIKNHFMKTESEDV